MWCAASGQRTAWSVAPSGQSRRLTAYAPHSAPTAPLASIAVHSGTVTVTSGTSSLIRPAAARR